MEIQTRYIIFAGIILTLGIIICMPFALANLMGGTQPEPVCISPGLHPDGLTRFWDTVEARQGFSGSSASLIHIDVDVNPDDTVQSVWLQYYAFKDGTDREYDTHYFNNSGACGYMYTKSHPANRTETDTLMPQHPRQFLQDVEKTPFSAIGMLNRTVTIGSYSSGGPKEFSPGDSCYEIYLMTNGSLQHMKKISGINTTYPQFPRRFSPLNCVTTEPGRRCAGERTVEILSSERLEGADLVYDTAAVPAIWKTCAIKNRFCSEEQMMCMNG